MTNIISTEESKIEGTVDNDVSKVIAVAETGIALQPPSLLKEGEEIIITVLLSEHAELNALLNNLVALGFTKLSGIATKVEKAGKSLLGKLDTDIADLAKKL